MTEKKSQRIHVYLAPHTLQTLQKVSKATGWSSAGVIRCGITAVAAATIRAHNCDQAGCFLDAIKSTLDAARMAQGKTPLPSKPPSTRRRRPAGNLKGAVAREVRRSKRTRKPSRKTAPRRKPS